MAIAFDNSGNFASSGSGTSAPVTFTVGSAANTVIGVFIQFFPAATATPTVTYSGTSSSITLIDSSVSDPSGNGDMWYYLIVNPQSGSQTVTVTASTAISFRRVAVESLSGVAQTSVVDNHGKGGTASAVGSASQSLTINTANSWLSWGVSQGNGNAATAGANTTIRTQNAGSIMADTNATQTTGSKTMNMTWVAQAWMGIMVSLAPFVAPTNNGDFLMFM